MLRDRALAWSRSAFLERGTSRRDAVSEAADLLWGDPGLARRRCERSACALLAVARVLRDEPELPGARAFLALHDAILRAAPASFTRIWQDPSAYHWTRRAVHLLAACRGAPLPPWEDAYRAALGARDARE